MFRARSEVTFIGNDMGSGKMRRRLETTMKPGLLSRLIRLAHLQNHNRMTEFHPMIGAAVILICGMAALSTWVGNRMEEGILQRAASETVLNMDSLIKPLLQNLAYEPSLPPTAQGALAAVLAGKAFGQEVAAIKIWTRHGTIAF